MRDEELVELAGRLGMTTFGAGYSPSERWLLTGDGMLAVITAMRERGWMYSMDGPGPDHACFSRDGDDFDLFVGDAPSMPKAVARAALAALTGREAANG